MGKRSPPLILELQIPFRFWSVAGGLCPFANGQEHKGTGLLGGTFLFGLGALEICLRLGGL